MCVGDDSITKNMSFSFFSEDGIVMQIDDKTVAAGQLIMQHLQHIANIILCGVRWAVAVFGLLLHMYGDVSSCLHKNDGRL